MSGYTERDMGRLERRARRLGFGKTANRRVNYRTREVAFRIPDRAPVTHPRDPSSSLVFKSEGNQSEAIEVDTYDVDETVVRFPMVFEDEMPESTLIGILDDIRADLDPYPNPEIRMNRTLPEHNPHFDFPPGRLDGFNLGTWLEQTWEAGQRYNRRVYEVVYAPD